MSDEASRRHGGDEKGGNGWSWLEGDEERVWRSASCFVCYMVYGASSAILGATLPVLADELDVSLSRVGLVFTTRGVGYLVGAMVSSIIVSDARISSFISQEQLASLALFFSGLMLIIVVLVPKLVTILLCFGLEGISFGFIEIVVNVALSALWGKRLQLVVHAVFSGYGLGSMLGPALSGAIGYQRTYIILAICSIIPLVMLRYQRICLRISKKMFALCVTTRSQTESSWMAVESRVGTTNALTHSPRDESHSITEIELSTVVNRLASARTGYELVDSSSREEEMSPIHKIVDESSATSLTNEHNEELELSSRNHSHLVKENLYSPWHIKLILSLFMFVYVGIEIGFPGWISAVAIDLHITQSHARAAYLVSIFWSAITIGRVLSIPVATWLTPLKFIRCQLFCVVVSALMVMLFLSTSYQQALILCATMGLSMSAIFPTVFTLVSDLGFPIDASTTSAIIIGGTLGASFLPMVMHLAIELAGARAMLYILFACACLMVVILSALMLCHARQSEDTSWRAIDRSLARLAEYFVEDYDSSVSDSEEAGPRYTGDMESDSEDDDLVEIALQSFS